MTTQDFPFTIGDAVARARLDADMTREELAVALGVGYRTICNWETDTFVPRGRHLAQLAQVTKAPWLVEAVGSARTRSRCLNAYADQPLLAMAG